jgi:hypothetical protein
VTGSEATARGAEPLWKFAKANFGSRPEAGVLPGAFCIATKALSFLIYIFLCAFVSPAFARAGLVAKFFKGKTMAQVPPVALSTIICERVLLDAPTKTSSVIGIIDRILSPQYPIRFPRLFFFAEMTNGHNTTELEVRIVDVQNDEKILIQRKTKVKFPDVKSIVSVIIAFEGLAFDHPGEYCFQLFAAGQILTSRRLVCLLVHKPPVNDNEQQKNPNT